MNIGEAIAAMRFGRKVARTGWNGKGMWLILVKGQSAELRGGTPYAAALNSDGKTQSSVVIEPHIDMYTAQGTMQPGWLASQADLLATDWEVVNG